MFKPDAVMLVLAVLMVSGAFVLPGNVAQAQESWEAEIRRQLASKDPKEQMTALQSVQASVDLCSDMSPLVPAIARVLTATDVLIRKEAIHTLEQLKGEAVSAVPALMRSAREGDRDMRTAALGALGIITEGSPQAMTTVMAALRDPDPLIRSAALEAVRSIGPGAARAVPILIQRLARPGTSDLWAIVRALAHIGPAASGARSALQEVPPMPPRELVSWYERRDVVTFFLSMHPTTVVGELRSALYHADPHIREGAAALLAAYYWNRSGVRQSLEAALADEEDPADADAIAEMLRHWDCHRR